MTRVDVLSILNRADANEVKAFVEDLLPRLEPLGITVLKNRTGLVMLPATDNVQGTRFHLGEVLVAEAHVKLGDIEGYTACLGRDLERSIAIALLDAASTLPAFTDEIMTFVGQHKARRDAEDSVLHQKLEETRVYMETF
jgi:alpha-D-ribose 1-methylphosphonate 5-triphosphate synthase subunit PhnG